MKCFMTLSEAFTRIYFEQFCRPEGSYFGLITVPNLIMVYKGSQNVNKLNT